MAPVTTTIKNIPSEVLLTGDDGLPAGCAINFDHIQTVSKYRLGALISTLSHAKLTEVRNALQNVSLPRGFFWSEDDVLMEIGQPSKAISVAEPLLAINPGTGHFILGQAFYTRVTLTATLLSTRGSFNQHLSGTRTGTAGIRRSTQKICIRLPSDLIEGVKTDHKNQVHHQGSVFDARSGTPE